MKKSFIRNIALGAACLVGVGGLVGATTFFTTTNNQVVEVKAETRTWSQTQPDGHDGTTEEKAYLLYNANDLHKFRDIVNGLNGETKNTSACAKLMDDINLQGNADNQWTPIGTIHEYNDMVDYSYWGHFDGNNHTISGLYIHTESTSKYLGLFGAFGYYNDNYEGSGPRSTIKNLTVEGEIYAPNSDFVGGIFGRSISHRTDMISNCVSRVNVTGDEKVGGLFGQFEGAEATKCMNFGAVTGNNCVGGITGRLLYGRIECSVNEGTISSLSTPGYYLAGIAGQALSYSSFDDFRPYVQNRDRFAITNCYNYGKINNSYSNDDKSSGIVAETSIPVSYCFNVGKVENFALAFMTSVESDTSYNDYQGSPVSGGNYTPTDGDFLYCYSLAGLGFEDQLIAIDYGCDIETSKILYRLDFKYTFQNEWSNFNDNWEYQEGADFPTLKNMPASVSIKFPEGSPDKKDPSESSLRVAEVTSGIVNAENYDDLPYAEALPGFNAINEDLAKTWNCPVKNDDCYLVYSIGKEEDGDGLYYDIYNVVVFYDGEYWGTFKDDNGYSKNLIKDYVDEWNYPVYYALGESGPVAEVDGVNYYSFLNAIKAVNDGGTIKLMDDVDLTNAGASVGQNYYINLYKGITIDLNGHNLVSDNPTTGGIGVHSTLTIDNVSSQTVGGLGNCIALLDGGSLVYKSARTVSSKTVIDNPDNSINATTGYEVDKINSDGSADQDGFVTIVHKPCIATEQLYVAGVDIVANGGRVDTTAEGVTNGSATLEYDIYYNPILVLDGFVYSGVGGSFDPGEFTNYTDIHSVFYFTGNRDLTVEIVGENTITNTFDGTIGTISPSLTPGSYITGFFAPQSNVTFVGENDGSLTIDTLGAGKELTGILAYSVTVDDCYIKIENKTATDDENISRYGINTASFVVKSGSLEIDAGGTLGDSSGIIAPLGGVTIGKDVDIFDVKGAVHAIVSQLKNEIAGYGWDNEGRKDIATSDTLQSVLTYTRVRFPQHEHSWKYTVSDNTITAECQNEGCPITEGLTLTINDPADLTFDDAAKTITFADGYNTEAFPNTSVTIEYYKDDVKVDSCEDAGTYEARVTIGDVTATKQFTIAQATPVPPAAPTDIEVKHGDTLGNIELDEGWSWKDPTEVVNGAGEHEFILIYTPDDPNYKPVEVKVTVTVETADPSYTKPDNLSATFGDKLSDIALPAGWTWKDPTLSVGDAGAHSFTAVYTPTDPNYHAKEDTLEVIVNQATPTGYEVPEDINVIYGKPLSDTPLPTGWTWKDPTETTTIVGTVEYIVIYTPADPNYKPVEVTITITVDKADPTYVVPTDVKGLTNHPLSDVKLPEGWSWKDPTQNMGSEEGEHKFLATYTPTDTTNYNVLNDIEITITVVNHVHDWKYTVDGDTITAECQNEGCPITEGLTLTVTVDDDVIYDGTDKTPALPTGIDTAVFPNPVIKYYKGGQEVETCEEAGTYEIKVTVGEVTVTKEFTIGQATPTGYEEPTEVVAKHGDKLADITLPEGWSWKDPTEVVNGAGEHEFTLIYTPEDPNYKPVEVTITVTVDKANPTYVVPTDVEAPYDVTLSKVALPEGFSWANPELKVNKWGENTFIAKFTPSDTTNYNIVENIEIKVNVKWILVDPTQGNVSVTINGDNEKYTVDITVKVEVKTEISVDQKRTSYASVGKEFVKPNEDITAIYGVKLIRTTNGVEEEIQPSDIKEGTKITVYMDIPEELIGKDFRLLHIHNANDVTEVTNYAVTKDGKRLVVEIDRLSEFAFIGASKTADNGFNYSTGLPAWAIALIVVGAVLLSCCLFILFLFLFFPVYYVDYSNKEVRRAIKIKSHGEEVVLINTHCQKVRRNKADVFKNIEDAKKVLG